MAAVATRGQRCSLLEVDAKRRQLVAVAAMHAPVGGDVEDLWQVGEGLDVGNVPEPGVSRVLHAEEDAVVRRVPASCRSEL
eukprot:16430828-Heterocapsa_arctica.AAC.1